MLTKHPNFFTELSYYIATVTAEELFRFLVHAQQFFVPLEKLFFGTDYPGSSMTRPGSAPSCCPSTRMPNGWAPRPIPQAKLDGILGDNFARMMGRLS